MRKIPKTGKYVVTALPKDGDLSDRLADLGVFPGTEVTIKRLVPFRGPAIVNIRGADYALRLTTLKKVGLKKK